MGLFLAMSGVVGVPQSSVVSALKSFAESKGGSLTEQELTTEDKECMVLSAGVRGMTVLYPWEFFDWDGAAQYLSKYLGKPVFSFHIHDGDLWMFSLFENGKVLDQFNPLPDYWQELDPDERLTWQGNAAKIASHLSGVSADQIEKYLVQWTDEVLDSDERKKAYPTDQFYYGDDWQLVDFMGKLGFDYPIDDRGEAHGDTYRFECKSIEDV